MQTYGFPPPILVLAAPGVPGQTLAAALGRNPAAYDLPELNLELMPSIDVLQREMTGIRASQLHGLLRALAQLLAGEQTVAAVDMANRWLLRRTYLPTSAVAQELAIRIAPRRLVAPVTAAIFDRSSLRRLHAAFPGAIFVHLHLHPHVYGRLLLAGTAGQAALQLAGALDETTRPATPDPQELWLMTETAISAFLADMPADQIVRQPIRDLVADPAATLTALAQRLGLSADAGAVTRMLRPELSVFAGPGPMGAHQRGNIQSFVALAAAMAGQQDAILTGPLPWRPDAAGFRPEVRHRAVQLGYS